MSDIVEKVTLYDLLGYVLPGGLLLGCVLIRYRGWSDPAVMALLKDYAGILTVFLLMLSFALGCIVSQAAGWLIFVLKTGWIWIKKLMRWMHLPAEEDNYEPAVMTNLKSALNNSGLLQGSAGISDDKLITTFRAQMYSDIQADRTYSRIHNYASGAVVNKNLMVVMLTGMLILQNDPALQSCRKFVCMAGCFFSLAFLARWGRFEKKKKDYTVYWYIEKYQGTRPS